MKNPFKEFLYFSMGDRRAIVALGCIAVFAVGVLMVVDAWKEKEGNVKTGEKVAVDVEEKEERGEVVMRMFLRRMGGSFLDINPYQ